MNLYIQFALLGLGAGALYAAVAQGLILAHRGAGVINLAHGAMAMYIAYSYTGLREGRFVIPPLPNPFAIVEGVAGWFGWHLDLPSWPTSVQMGETHGFLFSFVGAMLVAVALGAAVHFLVFRPLRHAPALAKTVASVGIAVILQAVVILRFGSDPVSVQPILSQRIVKTLGAPVPMDRYIFVALAVVVAVVLMAIFRFTRIGLATRAAAENERAAMLIGLSPDRLAGFNWILSSLIAGGAGVLFASMTGLNPTDFVLFVIPALGAALLARLESFTIALLAGLGIGIMQSLTLPLQTDLSWFPKVGAAAGVPLIVIVVAMILRGDKLPKRGAATVLRLPPCPIPVRPGRVLAILGPAALVAMVFLPYDLRGATINSLSAVVLALSFVVIVGMAGQVSLMQMTIAGMAGIAMTRVAGDWGIPFPIAPMLAILVAAASGVIAGIPALRVRGVHLAVLTLGAAWAFQAMILGNGSYVRVTDASGSVPDPHLFGLNFGVNEGFPIGSHGAPSAWFGIFVLLVAIGCCWGVVKLRRTELGLRFLAIRANEKAASALGVNVGRTKIAAFAIAALLAGTSGVLNAYRFGGVAGEQYAAMTSVSALALAYLGGITMVWGALYAGVLAAGGLSVVITDRLFHVGEFQTLMEGIGLVLTAILNPMGIAGAIQESASSIKARLAARRHGGDEVVALVEVHGADRPVDPSPEPPATALAAADSR